MVNLSYICTNKIVDMKVNYLFPNRYKKIGWIILIPSLIIGLVNLIMDYEPSFFDCIVPSIRIGDLSRDNNRFEMIKNNILNEIVGVFVIVGSLLVAFSKEKIEDEFIAKIRLESLVWAVYANYIILILAFLFVYDFSFLWIMIFNIFTMLLFFIIRYTWQISKLKKIANHAE